MDGRYHILDVVPIRVSTLYLKISPDAEIHSCKKKIKHLFSLIKNLFVICASMPENPIVILWMFFMLGI